MKRVLFLVAAALMMNVLYAQDTTVAKVVSEEESHPHHRHHKGHPGEMPPPPMDPNAPAAPAPAPKKVELKPYGFVRNYFYYDSRQTYNSNASLFEQLPKDEAMAVTIDGDEYDKNSESEINFLCITTRLGLDAKTRLQKTNVAAKIEADFCGISGSNFMVRLRQAYFKLDWMEKKHTLLLGQAWHPMSADLPDVFALASGSPFHPFSRTPQMRYDYKPGKMNFTAAALWQFQYKSVGPTGYDPKYNKIPEFYVGLDYSNNGFKVGAGLDIISVVPRTVVSDSVMSGEKTVLGTWSVDERITSCSPIFFINYKKELFSVKAKALFGQNTAHLSQYSGYVATEKFDDGSFDYKPMRNVTAWADVCYGAKWKVNLFGGYFKNLGASEEIVDGIMYMRNSVKNLDFTWRVCPGVSYNMKALTVGLEYELTGAGYGDGCDEYGKVETERKVYNNRLCCMMKFAW